MVAECTMRKCVRGNTPKLFCRYGHEKKFSCYSITIYYLETVLDPIYLQYRSS